jgi:molybdopterin biosynthesis enzyme
MTFAQRLPGALTPLDAALAAALDGLRPVAPLELPLAQAVGCIAAGMPASEPLPARDTAIADGWALCARDLVGASSYSPLPLAGLPVWVEAGDRMPEGFDCVLDADLVDASGPLAQALAEAIPGQGIRRAGDDSRNGAAIAAGSRIRPLDLLLARAAGLDRLTVRRPRVHVLNVPGGIITARLMAGSARAEGADVSCAEATSRDAASIAARLDAGCDLLITVGGSGVGRTDATVAALAARGEVRVHGIALQPGRTAAVGGIGNVPVLALPGAPDQALAAFWALALPLLDRLSGRLSREKVALPLARKIASSVGIAEFALLERAQGAWLPLAVGDLPLATIARADAWLAVPAGSEGFAAGTPADAYMLRE